MVAYSFKSQFEEPIATLAKRQTVRGYRKRHARPGEPVQLYAAMRTRNCRKILMPDPICIDVRQITIRFDWNRLELIRSIEIEGLPLSPIEMDAFARADGFDAEFGAPIVHMGRFWLDNHGLADFDGVVIRWEPAQ